MNQARIDPAQLRPAPSSSCTSPPRRRSNTTANRRAAKHLDYCPRTNIHEGEAGSSFEPSHALGISVFQEQLPVVDPAERGPVTYRTHRVSRDLQVWFVEGRDYRSPLDQPDGLPKTIWGAEQKA